MQLKKINELLKIRSEIYTFSEFNSHIIANKMYEAIDIFDVNLKIKRTIQLSENFVIDNIFFSQDTAQFALYSAEENIIAFCDTTRDNVHYISLPKKVPIILSRIYSWMSDKLVVSCYEGPFVIFHDCKVTVLEDEIEKQRSFPDLYNFSKYLNNFPKKFQINFANKSFISANELDRTITFNDLKKNSIISVSEPQIKYHDIIFANDIFVIISEDEVIIKNLNDSISIPSRTGEDFLRGAFIKTNVLYFYLLIGAKAKQSLSSIVKYELS